MIKLLFAIRKNVLVLLFLSIIFGISAQRPKKDFEPVPAEIQDSIWINKANQISNIFIQSGPDSVLFKALISKTLSEQINYPKGIADALFNISGYYTNKGNYKVALDHSLRALELYISLKSDSSKANVFAQMAYIYKKMAGQNRTITYLDTGLSFSKAAFEIYESVKDTAGMALSLNISGILYRDKRYAETNLAYFDTAFDNYTRALALIKTSGKGRNYLVKLYNNISQVYIEYKKDYQKGLSFLIKAESLNKAENNPISLSYNYGNMANAYSQLHDYPDALKYANEMLAISRKVQQPNLIHDALYELYQVNRAMGRSDIALRYYISAQWITDSLTNLEKTQQVADLRAKYETREKELEIRHLNLENDAISKRIWQLILALLLSALLFVWLIFLLRRVLSQKKKIALQSERLEIMMKELHHLVKNNLQIVSSLLNLQAYKLEDEKTVSVLRESQQRVQAMSLIHQRLYKNKEINSVNMEEYITDLAETLVSSYGYNKANFELQIHVEEEMVDVTLALPIGLIINEMITNAMKYAYMNIEFPLLEISLTCNADNRTLIVRDNGTGINRQLWEQEDQSFGKQLITALSKQLRAQQSFVIDGGTTFTIIIPNSNVA